MTVRFPITGEIGGDMVGMALAELRLCKVNRKKPSCFFTTPEPTRTMSRLFWPRARNWPGASSRLKFLSCPREKAKASISRR